MHMYLVRIMVTDNPEDRVRGLVQLPLSQVKRSEKPATGSNSRSDFAVVRPPCYELGRQLFLCIKGTAEFLSKMAAPCPQISRTLLISTLQTNMPHNCLVALDPHHVLVRQRRA